MKIIRHLRAGSVATAQRTAATLGNFDGVHRGHCEVLWRLLRESDQRGLSSVAITFHPHPAAVVDPGRAPARLTDLRQRIERLAETGVENLVLQRFSSSFAEISADDFITEFLVRRLKVRSVVIGKNVGFGRHRAGNAGLLERFGKTHGFNVDVVSPVEIDGRTVSSSAIRAAIADGRLRLAEQMLGRSYEVGGRVAHGDHRGKKLGIPTANLRLSHIQLPPDGVYAVRVRVGGRRLCGVANIGFKPTFGAAERAVEAHLFDFDDDIYGERMEVAFVEHLRGEIKFPGVDALLAQIHRDVAEARRILTGA